MPYDYLKQLINPWDSLRLNDKGMSREEIRAIHRWAAIYKRYKLTRGEWKVMFERQNGSSAVYGVSQEKLTHSLEIDQYHSTGR